MEWLVVLPGCLLLFVFVCFCLVCFHWLADCLVAGCGWFAGLLACFSVRLFGWLVVGWLVGWFGCLFGCLLVCVFAFVLVGWLVG